MHALTFHGIETIKYESVPDPKIESPHDVIVKIRLAGICGSDLHVYHGREKGLDTGTVMGHEFVGEIVDWGKAVRKFRKGDLVFSPFTTNCGECFYCRKDLPCRCTSGQLFGWVQNGVGLHSGQAEFVRVPLADSTLLRVPKNVLPEEALLLGDVLSTGYFCADMAEIKSDGTYAVIGCGPVGLMAIIGARELGAERIYAIDTIPERLALAAKFGATLIDYQKENPLAVIRDVTEGRGADAVLEAVGSPAAARLALDLVRPGGILAVAGVHTEEHFAFSPAEAYDKNLTYKVGRCPARYYAERLIPIVEKKKYDLTSMISHRLPLAEGVRGYKIFAEKLEGCTKVILKT
ncbi:MAG: alcohol dehydrogenase family protein [candidate division KSB1 bacterium]|nr:alcohol dehydrogenase family protein [candidate division KSB1 bacterium]MDZ7368982.1 alcohol dehydrogenase family protein [candidate division KSB1 bacterium]MDZ7406980.1 alcohol dehydrogenase family protein [candidate division KSB1 bacterium]